MGNDVRGSRRVAPTTNRGLPSLLPAVMVAMAMAVSGCLPPLSTSTGTTSDDPCSGKARACGSQSGTCYSCSATDTYCGAACTKNGTTYPWCCYSTPQTGYTTGVTTTTGTDTNPGYGCTGGQLECSQPVGSCGIQSCTCYYANSHGDVCMAWYHVGTSYFDCAHCGSDYVNCDAAAQGAAQACL